MDMRLRLPELLELRHLTAYSAAQKSGGRLDASTLYRIVRQGGRVKYFAADLCAALCDVLDIPPGELFSRDDEVPAPKPKSRRR